MSCKLVTCCDLDDFPQTSSSDDNCPLGYYWNINSLACKRIPSNAILGEEGQLALDEYGEPVLFE